MKEGGIEKRGAANAEVNKFGVSREAFMKDLLAQREGLLVNALALTERNKERAEELVQEAMTKAIENFKSYPATNTSKSGANPLAAWVYTIMRNEFYTQGRKIQTRKRNETKVGIYENMRTKQPNQAHDVETEQMIALARKYLEELSPRYREFINLATVEGLSQEEIADRLNIPIGTVKSGTKRAYDQLRVLMKKAVGE